MLEARVRILFPTDGSEGAAAARDKVIASFAPRAVAVELLLVVPPGRKPAGHERHAADRQRAEALLACEREHLEDGGFSVSTAIRTGHPAEEIVGRVENDRHDLVVVGSRHGPSGGRNFPGPVASKVAHHSQSSVLIARDGDAVRSVVLGYDESPDAEAALALLCDLPFRTAPEIAVFTAYEVPLPLSSKVASAMNGKAEAWRHEDVVEAHEAAQAIAHDAARRLQAAGMRATAHTARGRASEQLALIAEQRGADLVAVGSRGVVGIERFLLGSTSDELAATLHTSLLVARS